MLEIRKLSALIDEQDLDLAEIARSSLTNATIMALKATSETPDDEADLSYMNLSFLTLQAVFQTVIICFAGFIAARSKILTPDVQKHISTLNVQLLTPCLIFMKLASSLSLSALIDIAIIPILFVVTTGVSYSGARLVSRVLRFDSAESNFVTAMAVFGNSNSLPVSLTVSLAYTLPDLMWPDISNDNQDDVASRGILYLLIFQQLGQIVRWSWGYNTLLARNSGTKDSPDQYDEERTQLTTYDEEEGLSTNRDDEEAQTPVTGRAADTSAGYPLIDSGSSASLTTFASTKIATVQKQAGSWMRIVGKFMNPPLWSMFAAIMVASITPLKNEIFHSGGFIQNTFTKSVQQVGGMAIPMILLVLGSNLAPNDQSAPASPRYKSIVFASLLCRMVLPAFVLLPIIAVSVKFINISILDDPIFLVVAFILTVSPPAIQLSQICQLNEIFEKEMAGVLFWGYVVLTLPSTIIIVVSSLEVLEWAGTTKM